MRTALKAAQAANWNRRRRLTYGSPSRKRGKSPGLAARKALRIACTAQSSRCWSSVLLTNPQHSASSALSQIMSLGPAIPAKFAIAHVAVPCLSACCAIASLQRSSLPFGPLHEWIPSLPPFSTA